jgi:hypothetical protein
LINVQAAPQISFAEFPVGFCVNSSPYEIIASPLGGIFSGPGISGNLFVPSNAGEGTHAINYLVDDGICSVDSSFELLVEACVLVDEINTINEIDIYPNPASDWLSIDGLTGDTDCIVLNLQGQIVGQFTSNSTSNKFHIGNLSSGVYFLQWSDEKGFQTKKFVVSR